jgi:hypothetical protein
MQKWSDLWKEGMANYQEWKNRMSLRYEIEKMYDPKNVFPPEEGM